MGEHDSLLKGPVRVRLLVSEICSRLACREVTLDFNGGGEVVLRAVAV